MEKRDTERKRERDIEKDRERERERDYLAYNHVHHSGPYSPEIHHNVFLSGYISLYYYK